MEKNQGNSEDELRFFGMIKEGGGGGKKNFETFYKKVSKTELSKQNKATLKRYDQTGLRHSA
jgi:hypothetical protein